MKYYIRLGFMLGLSGFCAPMSIIAQDIQYKEQDPSFIEQLAIDDAHYEQSLVFLHKGDEMDYWGDQKSFEKELEAKKPEKYRAYISAKKVVYHQHASQCDQQCNHSSSFYMQALFYSEFEVPEYSLRTSIENNTSTPVNLLAVENKRN